MQQMANRSLTGPLAPLSPVHVRDKDSLNDIRGVGSYKGSRCMHASVRGSVSSLALLQRCV
jgi:hypothetical protein